MVLGAAVADLDGNGIPDFLEAQGVVITGLTGNGCSIASVNRTSSVDPTLPAIILLALVYLSSYRRKRSTVLTGTI